MMFLLKALLRTVPVAFGVGVLWGTILMGYACCQAFFGAEGLLAAQVTASLAGGILHLLGRLAFCRLSAVPALLARRRALPRAVAVCPAGPIDRAKRKLFSRRASPQAKQFSDP